MFNYVKMIRNLIIAFEFNMQKSMPEFNIYLYDTKTIVCFGYDS